MFNQNVNIAATTGRFQRIKDIAVVGAQIIFNKAS